MSFCLTKWRYEKQRVSLQYLHSNSWCHCFPLWWISIFWLEIYAETLFLYHYSFSPLIPLPSPPPFSFLLLFSSGRSYRAYKVAGITLLACVLIVGQVMTAYFLLTQKNEIKSLEEQSNKIKSDLTRGRSGEDGNNRLILKRINSFP